MGWNIHLLLLLHSSSVAVYSKSWLMELLTILNCTRSVLKIFSALRERVFDCEHICSCKIFWKYCEGYFFITINTKGCMVYPCRLNLRADKKSFASETYDSQNYLFCHVFSKCGTFSIVQCVMCLNYQIKFGQIYDRSNSLIVLSRQAQDNIIRALVQLFNNTGYAKRLDLARLWLQWPDHCLRHARTSMDMRWTLKFSFFRQLFLFFVFRSANLLRFKCFGVYRWVFTLWRCV